MTEAAGKVAISLDQLPTEFRKRESIAFLVGPFRVAAAALPLPCDPLYRKQAMSAFIDLIPRRL